MIVRTVSGLSGSFWVVWTVSGLSGQFLIFRKFTGLFGQFSQTHAHSFEAFTKDPFLVSCRSPPQIEALSCIFQVTTNRCMGELVRQEAQSYIQFFSSCLPLKPNSEDETPSSRLPSNTQRGKDKPQRTFFCISLCEF